MIRTSAVLATLVVAACEGDDEERFRANLSGAFGARGDDHLHRHRPLYRGRQ